VYPEGGVLLILVEEPQRLEESVAVPLLEGGERLPEGVVMSRLLYGSDRYDSDMVGHFTTLTICQFG
jgi:hypothetical protein